MRNPNTYVIIPVYNGEKTLQRVLKDIKKNLEGVKIIVVNDGSLDGTKNIASNYEVIYLEHRNNEGKGAALKSGFRKALELGAEFVVTIDADGQHEAGDVNRLLAKMSTDFLDLVIGVRTDVSQMPFIRLVSNKITTKLISWRIGQRIEDSQCGLRAHTARLLSGLILSSKRYDLETELLIKTGLYGYKIGSIDIRTIYHKDIKSSITFRDVLNFIRVFLQSFFWSTQR